MKKILFLIPLLFSLLNATSQSIVQRSTGANTLVDPNLFSSKSFRPPVYADTTAANAAGTGLDSCGKLIFTYDAMAFWGRACSPKRWVRVGASISLESSSSIIISGTGETTTPYTATVNISPQSDNALQNLGDGLYVKNKVVNGLNSGGILTWVAGYTYDVSAAEYAIGGIEYTAPETQITLQNADPTLDRIDVVIATTSGTIEVITGTPAANPQEPSVNVSTQLPLNFVYVTANTVEPVIPQDWIYENYPTPAWTTVSSGPRINRASTSNPFSAPTTIEGTSAINFDNILFTTVDALNISDYNVLTLKIRSKAPWINTSKLSFQWRNSSLATTGSPVVIANNSYEFQSTQTTHYQTISIPLSDFGLLTDPTNLLVTVITSGGATIGFYIDDIQLQNSEIPTFGNFHAQGGNIFGATSVLGTNDNYDLSILTNNIQRARILNTGTFLINRTTASTLLGSLSTPVLQVSGKGLVDKMILGTPTTEDEGVGDVLGIYGNTFIGSTAPTIYWNNRTLTLNGQSSAGRLALIASGTGSAFDIRHDRADGSMLNLRNSINSELSSIRFAAKTTSSLTLNSFTSTQGVNGYYLGFNLSNTSSSWDAPISTRGSYLEFYPFLSKTATNKLKIVGVSIDPGVTAKEIEYITYDARFVNPQTFHRVIFGSSTDDGSTLLQMNGSSKFIGLSTDNTGTQLLTKTSSGLNAWRDVSSITGGASTTFQQALSNGTTLTGNNTIAGGGFTFSFNNTNLTGTSAAGNNITLQNAGNDIILSTNTSTDKVIFTNTRPQATLFGSGSITGTPTFGLAVDASGNFIEVALGSGMTNPMTTEGDIIISDNNSGTPKRLAAGTAGYVLTSNGPGVEPSYQLVTGTGTVTNVTGTTNRITVATGTTTPVIDISSSYVGQSSIVTVGTITTGVWNGTSIGTSYTDAKVASVTGTSNRITIGGTATSPTVDVAATYVGQSSITTVGTLISGAAGTGFVIGGVTMTLGSDAAWDLYVRNASGVLQRIPNGTTNQVLTATTGAIPTWTTLAGGGGVSGVTGTANQVFVNGTSGSPQIGSVTLTLPQNIATTSTVRFENIGIGVAASVPFSKLTIGGSSTGGAFEISNSLSIEPAPSGAVNIISSGGTITEAASGNHALFTNLRLGTPAVIGGGATVANTAIIYVQGAMSATVTGANYAMWIDGGVSRFDGDIQMFGSSSGSITIAATANAGTNTITLPALTGTVALTSQITNQTNQTLTDGATITWNINNGGNAVVTLAGTGRTLSITNPVAGQTYVIRIIQGSGGSKTITTWPSGIKWPNGTAPTLSTTAGDIDIVTVFYDGTNYYGIPNYDFS